MQLKILPIAYPDVDITLSDLLNSPSILNGEIKDAFGKFRQLRQKRTATSAPLMSTDGSLLSDKASVMTRWQEHFSTLLNRPLHPPLVALLSEAAASTPDPLIDTCPVAHPRYLRHMQLQTR